MSSVERLDKEILLRNPSLCLSSARQKGQWRYPTIIFKSDDRNFHLILGLNDPEEHFLLYDTLLMVWLELLRRTRCMKHGALKQRLDSWLLFLCLGIWG